MPNTPQFFDPAVLTLFRKELSTQATRLSEAVEALKSGEQSPQIFEKIWNAARQVKSAAHIMHFASLIALTDALEEASLRMRKSPSNIHGKILTLLEQCIKCFRTIAALESGDLTPQLLKRDEEMEVLSKALQAPNAPESAKETPQKKY